MASTTEKRYRAFAKAYLRLSCNASAAYAEVYGTKGDTNKANGWRHLQRPKVQKYIQEEYDRNQTRMDLQQDRTVLEVMKVAYSDMAQYVAWGPDGVELRDSTLLPEGATAAIAEIRCRMTTRKSMTEAGPVEETESHTYLRLHPKLQALAQLQGYYLKGVPLDKESEAAIARLVALTVNHVQSEQRRSFLEAVQTELHGVLSEQAENDLVELLEEAERYANTNGRGYIDAPRRNGT